MTLRSPLLLASALCLAALGQQSALAASNLTGTALTAPAASGDCAGLAVSGSVDLEVRNEGPDDLSVPVDVLAFADLDGDGAYTPGTDTDLGTAGLSPPLAAGAGVLVAVPLGGELPFRDAPVHLWIDSGSVEAESDETDNVASTAELCSLPPVGSDFDVVVEWEWRSDSVATAPLVGDVNADGTPDVVFVSIEGILWCLDGRTGTEHWSTFGDDQQPSSQTSPALAELDGDPGLEIVALSGDGLGIWDDDGTYLRQAAGLVTPIGFPRAGAVSIADMDCDGSPEGIFQNGVVNLDTGLPYWIPVTGAPGWVTLGSNSGYSGISSTADLDGDGFLEVLAGPMAYTLDRGTGRNAVMWRNFDIGDGYSVPVQLDADPGPEVVVVHDGRLALLEGEDGATIWDVPLPSMGPTCMPQVSLGGPPTIADFDGDGAAEIGVADGEWYHVFEGDGSLLWQSPTSDCSSASTGSTVFDFDGDGAAEVVYQDEENLHIFRGTDGFQLARVPTSHGTIQEQPTVADVDGDGRAEIVAGMTEWGASRLKGLRVYGDANDNWVNARRIWNQHSYHVGNVNDDGTIPPTGNGACQESSWETHESYRQQPPPGGSALGRPDLTLHVGDGSWSVEANPICGHDLVVDALVGNGGSAAAGTDFQLWLYQGDPALDGRALQALRVADLAAGESRIVTMRARIREPGDYHLLLDDNGLGRGAGLVAECREDNNACSVEVLSVPPDPDRPQPVGNALRATGHGDPRADTITASFSWLDDEGLPRPTGEHYHVLRSTNPSTLAPVGGEHPWDALTWEDATPASALLPTCHYLRIAAANACERLQELP
jgi:hypothetical protein